ncbi:MAG: sulfate respiration complex protein HmcE [Desulfobaccales bacterium]
MPQFYQFITGPLLWLSFGIFFVGLTFRVVRYVQGLDWQLDRVAYRAHPVLGLKGALRSIIHWLVPFYSEGWRAKPLYTVIFFIFHIGLVLTPLFLLGHVVIFKERWGMDWPMLSMGLADVLTIGVMITAICIAIRRLALPEVRIVTTCYDLLLLLLSVAPFVTGFLAVHQAPHYDLWLYSHILSSELLLVAIPFTKLSHVVGFFLSRGQIGADFGIKRGYKGKGFAW